MPYRFCRWALAMLVSVVLPGVVPGHAANRQGVKPVRIANLDRGRIVQYPNGTLVAFSVAGAGGRQWVSARLSSSNGASWDEPARTLELPVEAGTWGGLESLVDREGEVHLFLLNDAHTGVFGRGEGQRPKVGTMAEQRLDIWHAKSTGGRNSWTQPKRIWQGYTGALNSVIQLQTGRMLLPFSYLTTRKWSDRGEGLDAFTFMGQYNSTLVFSDDAGKSWQVAPAHLKIPVPDIVSAYGAVEPVILELKDGRVWMLIRAQTGRFYESFSADGLSWSKPRPSQIVSSDSPAGLARLKDGRILLLWNQCLRHPYAYGGRQVLHGAISEDEGRSWRGYREVARDPLRNQPPPPRGDHGTAYPFPTATADGKAMYTTGQGEGRVQIMRLDPDWLYETFQRDDFSEGLEEWSTFGTKGVELQPRASGPGQLMAIRKTDAEWPAAAVWNFPLGKAGRLRLKISVRSGFQGALIGITDHFSTPFEEEDRFYNLFNFEIGPDGRLPQGAKLDSNRWHDLQFAWDMAKRECRVFQGNRQIASLPLQRSSEGPCYLRLRSVANEVDPAGFLIDSVEVDVSPP